jgi:hypothetical protein
MTLPRVIVIAGAIILTCFIVGLIFLGIGNG